jgi:hypothetical protein
MPPDSPGRLGKDRERRINTEGDGEGWNGGVGARQGRVPRPPLPPPGPLRCPGSGVPESRRKAGDTVPCAICGRRVVLVELPEDQRRDSWQGSELARITPHCLKPMLECEARN